MLPMLLTPVDQVPINNEWFYETKYDGFRCIFTWDEKPKLFSRNEKDLTNLFPELLEFCLQNFEQFKPYLPISLDGEIVYLVNNFSSNFSVVQSRGRMRTEKRILEASHMFPCNLVIFDILCYKGKDLTQTPLTKRKEKLHFLFQKTGLPLTIDYTKKGQLQAIGVFQNEEELWKQVLLHNGEGIIAKKKTSIWEKSKRSNLWLKMKNWRIVTVILTKYDQLNGYFNGAIYSNNRIVEITNFRHGLSNEEMNTLSTFFQVNGRKISPTIWELSPSICVDIACIDFDEKKLREPRFHSFRFDVSPREVTWRNMQRQLNPLPENVQMTHPDKPVWPEINIVKDDYLIYLQQIAPYFLPFLNERLLTAIRFPHGVLGESFYQKNAPAYTPNFVVTKQVEDIDYIVCNNIESLLWLGNQLVLEFHIPFQTIDTDFPTEMVFDLDPPSVDEFSLAIEAAIRMKTIFDNFNLKSFVKTSGGKGLQLYIPLPKNKFTYDDTRIFMEFVCRFLCEQEPHWFTIERLKKNRHNKLYLDYVQHAEGKTIISPYSPRGKNEEGLVATPLYWYEVNTTLSPKTFTIPAVLDRVKTKGDPFKDFVKIGEKQDFQSVLLTLKELTKHKK